MNLDGLRAEAERLLLHVERAVAFDVLAAEMARAERRRYRCLSKVRIAVYLTPGETVELRRSMMPKNERYYGASAPERVFRWRHWTALKVEHIGDCVRVLVPHYGVMSIPRGDFVQAVINGHVRAPLLNTAPDSGVEASSPCSDNSTSTTGSKPSATPENPKPTAPRT